MPYLKQYATHNYELNKVKTLSVMPSLVLVLSLWPLASLTGLVSAYATT